MPTVVLSRVEAEAMKAGWPPVTDVSRAEEILTRPRVIPADFKRFEAERRAELGLGKSDDLPLTREEFSDALDIIAALDYLASINYEVRQMLRDGFTNG